MWMFDEVEDIGNDELCVYHVSADTNFLGNYYLKAIINEIKDQNPLIGIVVVDPNIELDK